MAQPIRFPAANAVWKTPEGRTDVIDLPSVRHGEQTISCWQLTDDEKAEIARTGVVWLHVIGAHPPVLVSGMDPTDDFPKE